MGRLPVGCAVNDHPEGLASAALGSLVGLAFADHNGVPTIFVVFLIAVALAFGIAAAAARSTDMVLRQEAMRRARINAGVLFFVNVSMTWMLNLSIPAAIMGAIVTGLVGSELIEKLASPSGQRLTEWVAAILSLIAKGGK